MCLLIFRWQPEQEERLLLLGNRDEFYARPSLSAHFWQEQPAMLAGRDKQAGGTWLAIDQNQRFCTVTNYREIPAKTGSKSRGEIPVSYIASNMSASAFASNLRKRSDSYSGYNALLFDGNELVYISNRSDTPPQVLEAGDYTLSNHLLNTPWPKTERLKVLFRSALGQELHPQARDQTLLSLMTDQNRPNDERLPTTGIGLEGERLLSPIFIRSEHYGTRTTSLISLRSRSSYFIERNYATGSTDQLTYSDAAFEIAH